MSAEYLLAPDERQVVLSALDAYASETAHYLRSSVFTPCAPSCEHCAPRVAMSQEMTKDLERRALSIVAAYVSLHDDRGGR